MRKLIIILLVGVASTAYSQKYITKSGHTEFKASVKAFEPVEAVNHSTTAVINSSNGEVAALIFIKAFHFKVALMEEHFNENYMDSDAYPKATFRGAIDGFKLDEIGNEEMMLPLKGTLKIRGEQKQIDTPVFIRKQKDQLLVRTTFEVTPQEFGIEIPSIVREKIAKSIKIKVNYELTEKD